MSANHIVISSDFPVFPMPLSQQSFQDWLLLVGDLIPSPMFVSIFVQYALWLKIIGHHEKHLGESSNMYDQIRQGSLLEDHDSKWLATFYHPLAYPSVSGSYLARPGVVYTYTYNVCFFLFGRTRDDK